MVNETVDLKDWLTRVKEMESRINKIVVGLEPQVRFILTALIARGHCLLEGDVGVGKTTVLKAFASAIGGGFVRVEGTIDLMPNDLIYHTWLDESGQPHVEAGPAICKGEDLSVFFFNEINRTRPQVHSLLLRMMAERSVTAFNKEHFFPHLTVFADRNRVEREETFEIPAAARDRFMMEIRIPSPSVDHHRENLMFNPMFSDIDSQIALLAEDAIPFKSLNMLAKAIEHSVKTSDVVKNYALDLWKASNDPDLFGIEVEGEQGSSLILSGIGPRGAAMLTKAAKTYAWLNGDAVLKPEHLKAVFKEVVAHRLVFKPSFEVHRQEIAPLYVQGILNKVSLR